MEVLKSIKQHLIRVGINPTQSAQKHSFNARNLVAFFLLSCCIASIVLHIIYVDSNFKEYTNAFIMTATILYVYVLKMETAFEIINTMENLAGLEFSTSKTIHKRTNRTVEKLGKIVNFFLVMFTPNYAFILMLIVGYVGYYFTKLEIDAFGLLLVLPMW